MSEVDKDDDLDGKVYDRQLMKRLLWYLRPYKRYIVISVILLLGVAGLRLVGPYLTKTAIDVYIANGDVDGLNTVGILYIVTLLLTFLFRFLQIYLTNVAGQRVMYDVRIAVYKHMNRLSLSYYDRNPVGKLITRVTNDIEALNEMFSSGVVNIFGDVFTLVGIMIAMIWLDWKLAIITYMVLPILIWAAMIFRKKVRTAFHEVRRWVAGINSSLQESITGMAVVQLFNRQGRNFEEFEQTNKGHQDAYIETIRYYAVFYPAVEIISAIAIGLIIWYGGGEVIQGALSLGVLIAFIQYVQLFFNPIYNLSEQYNTMQAAMAASERLFAVLDEEPEIDDVTDPMEMESTTGEIEFRNVWFAYSEEEWVLRDVSFMVHSGQRAAFVGATGAGKTTIISLMCRFYDVQRGTILVDGVDIKNIRQKDLRRHVGMVLQDVFLFSGTILDNIRLWSDSISEDEARAATTSVNALRFIEKLPEQLQTVLGERGNTLSVGQRQLLAFARTLAHDPAILVLDEATSNIDTETELLIQDALEKLMAGRTSIIIAHRLSTIQNADQIIVLHKGQVQESGTHQDLLELRGVYFKLYQLQYKDQEWVNRQI
jgi:ATP-binding cassette, subfamily B, multidrug efflux pump